MHGLRTQAYGESSRLKSCKMVRPIKVLGCWGSTPLVGSLGGLFILASDISSDDYSLHHDEQLNSISASFGVSIHFLRSALLCQTILLKSWGYLFLSKVFFGAMCHWSECYMFMPNSTCKFVITPFFFDKRLGLQVVHSKVGGIVPGRLGKLIIIPLSFPAKGEFQP